MDICVRAIEYIVLRSDSLCLVDFRKLLFPERSVTTSDAYSLGR